MDLGGTLDGQPWDGVAVGSAATSHTIDIVSKTDVNFFRIISCHRYEMFEDVIRTGWFRPNRGYEYKYTQSPGIEDTGFCVLRLQAFSKAVDSNGAPIGSAFGLMLFHNGQFKLAAENICNGDDGQSTGTTICQSMNGLVQRLRFKTQVVTAPPAPDSATYPKACVGHFIDAYTWEYAMPLGECVVVFGTTAQPQQFAIHLAYGFSNSQYRGGN